MHLDFSASVVTMPVRPAGKPFDSWLQRQLHDMYDSITREPLPDDLVRLIEEGVVPDTEPGQQGPGRPGTLPAPRR